MSYNGWKNHATWNTYNWLSGYEDSYHAACRVTKGGSIKAASQALKMHCIEIWGMSNPDGDSLAKVDWEHIAEAFRE